MKRNLPSIILIILLLLVKSINAQITFTSLTTPTTLSLYGVSFADTSIGYACGNTGTILKTINGGTTWTVLTTGTTENLWDIKVIPNSAGQKVIAVGDNNKVIKSINGGTTWTPQTIPFQSGSYVFGVQCFDSLNYFACGGDFATLSGATLKTTNGGTTWAETFVGGSAFLDKVFMLNATTGFTVGTNLSFSDGSIHKTTNGTSFSVVKTTSSVITNLWCNNAANIVAVGVAGQIWKSTDAGTTWINNSFNTTDLFGIQFIDSLNGFACGGSASGNIILQTTDGGNTWSQINFSFNGSFLSLCIIENKIYIVGDLGKIIKATLPVTTGINEFDNNFSIFVSPNPANDKINISVINQSPFSMFQFQLFDVNGKKIKDIPIANGNSSTSISELQSGLYFYQLINSGKIISGDKIIIK